MTPSPPHCDHASVVNSRESPHPESRPRCSRRGSANRHAGRLVGVVDPAIAPSSARRLQTRPRAARCAQRSRAAAPRRSRPLATSGRGTRSRRMHAVEVYAIGSGRAVSCGNVRPDRTLLEHPSGSRSGTDEPRIPSYRASHFLTKINRPSTCREMAIAGGTYPSHNRDRCGIIFPP